MGRGGLLLPCFEKRRVGRLTTPEACDTRDAPWIPADVATAAGKEYDGVVERAEAMAL